MSEDEYQYEEDIDEMEYEYNDSDGDCSVGSYDGEGQSEAKAGFMSDEGGGSTPPILLRTESYKIFTIKMLFKRKNKLVNEMVDLMGWTKTQVRAVYFYRC